MKKVNSRNSYIAKAVLLIVKVVMGIAFLIALSIASLTIRSKFKKPVNYPLPEQLSISPTSGRPGRETSSDTSTTLDNLHGQYNDYDFITNQPVLDSEAFNTLAKIHTIIVKFLQDINYSEEISSVDVGQVSCDIKSVLRDLSSYSTKYLESTSSQNLSLNSRYYKLNNLLDYLFRIEKLHYSPNQKEQDRKKIIERLPTLEEYFYNQQFLTKKSYG